MFEVDIGMPTKVADQSSPLEKMSEQISDAKEFMRLLVKMCLVFALPPLIFCWVIYLVGIKNPGIHPMTFDWTVPVGLFSFHFLHGSLSHIWRNSWGWLILSPLVLMKDVTQIIDETKGSDKPRVKIPKLLLYLFLTTSVTGLLVWVIGGINTNHIGLSSLLYAMMSFLLLQMVFEETVSSSSIIGLLVVLFTYAIPELIFGLLPGSHGTSWQGHLSGFIAGVLIAYYRPHEESEYDDEKIRCFRTCRRRKGSVFGTTRPTLGMDTLVGDDVVELIEANQNRYMKTVRVFDVERN